jgi:hypothetical protein
MEFTGLVEVAQTVQILALYTSWHPMLRIVAPWILTPMSRTAVERFAFSEHGQTNDRVDP